MGRLLLADRYRLSIQALEALLAREGHEVVGGCATERDLLAAVAVHQPDLVLVDAQLAGLERAPSVVEAALRAAPGTKVLVLATEPDVQLAKAAVLAGAVGVLSRTSDGPAIARAVRAALLGEGVVPRGMLPALFQGLAGAGPAPDPLQALSRRERQVLTLMGRGLDNARIAAELSISPNTVRTHVQNVLAKLGMHSKLEAVTYAARRAAR
jgi:DNA-binding NarL/FixJ family response regulator